MGYTVYIQLHNWGTVCTRLQLWPSNNSEHDTLMMLMMKMMKMKIKMMSGITVEGPTFYQNVHTNPCSPA